MTWRAGSARPCAKAGCGQVVLTHGLPKIMECAAVNLSPNMVTAYNMVGCCP
jgi:hypothetical protein